MASTLSHRHLLDIKRLSVTDINAIFDLAEHYVEQNRSLAKKSLKLDGKTVVKLFFEPSTRTRTSFELAARRLGADVLNIAAEHSSTKKGETPLDTALNLDAMHIDALVLRHAEDGVPHLIAPHMKASVINAGDGKHAHPTQALLDVFTMRRHKKVLKDLVVGMCGDIGHSRVARSNIQLLHKMGAKVRLIAPPGLMDTNLLNPDTTLYEDMTEGLQGVDVIMMLRIQHERMVEGEFAMSLPEYHQRYGLDHKKIASAKPNVIVMHPGPVNRNVELTSSLADDPKFSVIREQVEMGVAVRMAILDLLLGTS
jgi:aspartate carbamoyltransferase catalytic subunit